MKIGISTGNAARQIGVSQQYIGRLIATGRLKATLTDLGYLVDPDDLDRFQREREAKAREVEEAGV